MGSQGGMDWGMMFHALAGTGLLACGASALNQLWERDYDARMRRTETRPLPSGRLSPETVLRFGSVCCVAGVVYLAVAVNALTSLLGGLTAGIYLFVYTPLKRVTWLNTVIGAVPGGLPPLMGWTAARGDLSFEGLFLFGIQFFWQMPHFLAIAWIYREDYAKAGFRMLPVVEEDGRRTGRQALWHALGLCGLSLCPAVFGLAGGLYLAGALALGLTFVALATGFAGQLSIRRARWLFYASILYLPLLLALMVFDKVKAF